MKVLHVNSNYLYTNLHQSMIEFLTARHIGSIVYVPISDRKGAVVKPNENVVAVECFNKWDRLVFDYKQTKILRGLYESVDLKGIDLVHAYTLFTDGNCARKIKKKYGIPYVVAIRNTDVNAFFKLRPHLRRRGLQIMLDAEAVFFLSDAYKEQVYNNYIPAEFREALLKKTEVIPNGIDPFWIKNPPEQLLVPDFSHEIRLIYAGRIDKNKNITSTQAAMKILEQWGYHVSLTVVGKVAEKKVMAQIEKDPHTICLAPRPKEELIRQYRDHHIFVMPSHNETFGLVYAEAMSQGLPVVYTRGQGFDCQFPEGEVGYHVNATRPEEIADAILRIVNDYECIQKRCITNYTRFNWENITERYYAVYHAILNRKQ